MSLDDIRARAKEYPCTTLGHTACTRQDRDRLLAALDAVLALHGEAEGFCVHCGGRTDFIDYPCPTVQAITEALR